MTVKDAVKKSGTPIGLSGASLGAADALIQPGEQVSYAVVANCTVDGGTKSNGAFVVTSHRLLFCSSLLGVKSNYYFRLGDCVGVGNITGKLLGTMPVTSEGHTIIVELAPNFLVNLQAAILDAIAAYPTQQPIAFAPNPHVTPKRVSTAKQRIKGNKAAGVACCPKCGSTSLSANKKGFSAGKAAAGIFLTGGLAGAVAGGFGANKIEVTCLNCGHKFRP